MKYSDTSLRYLIEPLGIIHNVLAGKCLIFIIKVVTTSVQVALGQPPGVFGSAFRWLWVCFRVALGPPSSVFGSAFRCLSGVFQVSLVSLQVSLGPL